MTTKKAKVKAARANYEHVKKTSKPGSGKRFKAVTEELEAEGKSEESAKKISGYLGRKKYGAKKMGEMSAAGRKK